MRKLINDPFLRGMNTPNASIAMDASSSKGFTKWVNKDIQKAAASGDWSDLIKKAEKSTRSFRNGFYK